MQNGVTKDPGVLALLVVLGLAFSSAIAVAAAPAADQAMLAADGAFVRAVAQGDVKTAAGFLDQDAAWTAADGATLNALQIRQKMPTPALGDEAGAERSSTATVRSGWCRSTPASCTACASG